MFRGIKKAGNTATQCALPALLHGGWKTVTALPATVLKTSHQTRYFFFFDFFFATFLAFFFVAMVYSFGLWLED